MIQLYICVFNCLLNVAVIEKSRRCCGIALQGVGPAMLISMVDLVNGTHCALGSAGL